MCQAVIGASNELIGLILIPTTEGRCYYYARFIGEAMETQSGRVSQSRSHSRVDGGTRICPHAG